jgi:hypothetical protein
MLEGFEDVARLYFEGQGYIVSGSVSIPFVGDKETKRRERLLAAVGPTDPAIQIDLVAARADELVICEVKSWFKSTGLVFDRHFSDDPSGREIKLFRNEQYRNYVARNLPLPAFVWLESCGRHRLAGVEVQPAAVEVDCRSEA